MCGHCCDFTILIFEVVPLILFVFPGQVSFGLQERGELQAKRTRRENLYMRSNTRI